MMSGQAFIDAVNSGDRLRARGEIEKLVLETSRKVNAGEIPQILWGMASSMPEKAMRTAIGILLEYVRLRTRDWRSMGAIQQLAGLLKKENIEQKKYLDRSESLRLERLLMSYVLRHPREESISPEVMNILHDNIGLKPIYHRALMTYARGRIFSPANRAHFRERVRKKSDRYKMRNK